MAEHEHEQDDETPLYLCAHSGKRETTPTGWVRCSRCGRTLGRAGEGDDDAD